MYGPRIQNKRLVSALLLLSTGAVLVAVPGLTILLSNFNLATPIHTQAMTLLGITALSSMLIMAAGYVIWWVAKMVLNQAIRRAEAEVYAYFRVQQEYEWKIMLFEHASTSHHPPIGPTVVDPHAKVIPFVPLKKRLTSSDRRIEKNGN